MTKIRLPLEQYDDLEIKNVYAERVAKGYAPEDVMASIWARGRDNARTPMQWDGSDNAGFTTGTPWLPVNPNYRGINAEAALADENSVFHYYRKLIALRKRTPVIQRGSFALVDAQNEKVFAYTRDLEDQKLLVVCNFTAEEVDFPIPGEFADAETLISNYPGRTSRLRPYEAFMLLK